MRGKFVKQLTAVIAAAALVFTAYTPAGAVFTQTAVAADEVIRVPVKADIDVDSAKAILPMINELRTSTTDNWYWNESDTEKVKAEGLSALSWDDGLGQAAMQRAVEIAVSYGHTRPDGSSCFTAVKNKIDYNAYAGENIAIGQRSAEEVNKDWREDKYKYSGQGHRRNMLSSYYSYVGIGHAVVNGIDCWVEEFGSKPATGATYSLVNGAQDVNVDVALSTIPDDGWDMQTYYDISSMKVGETVTIPDISCTLKTNGTWRQMKPVPIDDTITASIGDTDVAALSGTSLKALKAGTFDVTLSGKYCTKKIGVTVSEDSGKSEHEWNDTTGDDKWTFVNDLGDAKIRYTGMATFVGGFIWIEAKSKDGSEITFSTDDKMTVTDQGYRLDETSLDKDNILYGDDGYYKATIKAIKYGQSTIRFTSADNKVSHSFTVQITAPIRTLRLVYDNGAAATSTNVSGELPELPAPTRAGYTFDGWYASDGTMAYTGMELDPDDDSDITLTAHWTKIPSQDPTPTPEPQPTDEDTKTPSQDPTPTPEPQPTDEDTKTPSQDDPIPETQPSDDTDSYTPVVSVKKPSKVTRISIKKKGKNKAKITWKKQKGVTYTIVVKVGKKTYKKTTKKTSYTVSAKKKQKITVKIRAYRKASGGKKLYGVWNRKSVKL